MELDTNLYKGQPLSLEEGSMNYHNSNTYIFDGPERKTACNRFIQIVKIIFYIELIVVIGWLGCVLISEYDGPRSNDEFELWTNTKCESSEMGCTVFEIVERSNVENVEMENRRKTRSVNDIQLARETCQRSINTTLRRFDDLANRVVIGETSDPNIVKLRQRFVQEIIFLTLRVIFVQSNDTLHATPLTDDQWSSFALGIKQAIVNSADSEHRNRLEASGPLSQEITNDIRETVESMVRDYMNCETILPTPRLGNSKGTKQQALRLVEIVLERERCGSNLNITRERLLALTAQIVIGDPTDPIVVRLRQDAGSKLMSIPQTFLGDIRNETIVKTALANLSNADWNTLLVELKKELSTSTDFQHRRQLETSGPPTREMANELQDIVEYFLVDDRKCQKLFSNTLSAGKGKRRRQRALRSRRASASIKYSRSDCLDDEKQLLEDRRARLDAIANADVSGDPSRMKTKAFLDAVEAALNITSPSEVTVTDDLLQNDYGLIMWKEFLANSSLEVKKEFYELVRDEFLELRNVRSQPAVWEGYDLSSVYTNFTNSMVPFPENVTSEAMLNIIVKCGKSFNLHYLEFEDESGLKDPKTPVFGRLAYLDKEPEKLGVRHMRHILNGYVRLFFRALNLPGPCHPIREPRSDGVKKETSNKNRRSAKERSAADQISESITSPCPGGEQDPLLLEERQARLEYFSNKTQRRYLLKSYEVEVLNAFERALNATSTSDIHFEEKYMGEGYIMPSIMYLMSNASLDIHKETYELLRDLLLEFRQLQNISTGWEGFEPVADNLRFIMRFATNISSQSIFNDFVRIGEAFDLRYVQFENGDSRNESNEPIFGKFKYNGESSEPLGVRRIRHILDGFIKIYFKTQYPSTPGMCHPSTNSKAQAAKSGTSTRGKRSVKKRFASADAKPKPITTTCWSKEQETVLLEERRERLEAFSHNNVSDSQYEMEILKRLFNAIEAALNATSTSEIRFDDGLLNSSMVLGAIHYLVSNTSLELHKEGYELCRDLFIEMYKLNYRHPDWDNHNIDSIAANLSSAVFVTGPSMTSQTIFTNFVNCGKAFNLRYVELEIRDSEDEPNKLVFGKFINLGEKPEKVGIRNLRHILDGFVRFYFKTQYPSRGCNSRELPGADSGATTTSTPIEHAIEKRFVTADPLATPITTTCGSQEQDAVLLEERRERLDAFAKKNATADAPNPYTQDYLNAIAAALNATSTSEIRFDEQLMEATPMLSFIQYITANSSLEVRKEGYEFSRDLYLEMLELRDNSSAWEGYDEDHLIANISQEHRILFSRVNATAQSIFNDYIRFGQVFNLRYDELETRNAEDESNKPVLGKFTYLGEKPEKTGLRRLRHILDGFVKLYFKTQNPSSPQCNESAQPRTEAGENGIPTPEKRSVNKRSVSVDRGPVFSTTCWNLQQDETLLQERRERLETFAKKNATATQRNTYMQNCLQSIEAALNATSISEISFEEELLRSTPALMLIEELVANSSLELRKEGYEFSRDLYLEMIELSDRSPNWEGYDENSIAANISESVIFTEANATSWTIFNDFVKFGKIFNLRYDEVVNRDSGVEPNEPVYGKFVYLGEKPEKLGVSRLRHILDSFAKIYFKVQNPSKQVVCYRTRLERHAQGGNQPPAAAA